MGQILICLPYLSVVPTVVKGEIHMIVWGVQQKPKSRIEDVFAAMEKSNKHFFLTGSRFFGYAKPESDYDFLLKSLDSVSYDFSISLKFLDLLGFELAHPEHVKEHDYWDTLFTHKEFPIHVILTDNIDRKLLVQRDIKKMILSNKPLFDCLSNDKPARKLLWRAIEYAYSIPL